MLRDLLSALVVVFWSLWFGGQVALLLMVTTLFKALGERTFMDDGTGVFGVVGSTLFNSFNRYQLIVGAAALVMTLALRVINRSGICTALFSLLSLAAIGVVVITFLFTPKIDKMRADRATKTPEFGKLHGQAMMVASADTLLLLAAGATLPKALRRTRGE